MQEEIDHWMKQYLTLMQQRENDRRWNGWRSDGWRDG